VSHASTSTSTSTAEIAAGIRARIVEKTGYPEDMLEADLDLEGDLGIDTLKQAEIWTELGRQYSIANLQEHHWLPWHLQAPSTRTGQAVKCQSRTLCYPIDDRAINALYSHDNWRMYAGDQTLGRDVFGTSHRVATPHSS
jgi:hypothetical protein